MKKNLQRIGLLLLAGLLYLGFYPIDLDPAARPSPPYPGMEGDFKVNRLLASTSIIAVGGIGPESIARDSLGNFYSGLDNGDIIRFDASGANQTIIGNTKGRPLGMKFAPNGWLIIADRDMGLIALDSMGSITTLLNRIEGTPIQFADDLAITQEGVVYFSDATQRNPIIIENEFWEQRPSGRIITYDLNTKEAAVVLDELFFANGVALDQNEDYIIINETFGLEIKRHWIGGAKKGTTEVFTNKLPGFPDNVTFADGIFWIAIPSQRALEVEPLTKLPFLRSVLLRLPKFVRDGIIPKPYSMILGFDSKGKLQYNLQDPNGGYDYITSVLQVDDKLYLGSLKEAAIGIYTLKKETHD